MSFIFSTYEDYASENDFGKVDWEKEDFETEKKDFEKEKEALKESLKKELEKEKETLKESLKKELEKEKKAFEKDKKEKDIKIQAEDEMIEDLLISGCLLHYNKDIHGGPQKQNVKDNDDKMARITYSIGLLADSEIGLILPDQIKIMIKKKLVDYQHMTQIAEYKESIKESIQTKVFDMKMREYMFKNVPGYGTETILKEPFTIPFWNKGGWDYKQCAKNIEKLFTML